MVSRFFMKKGSKRLTPKEAAGRSPDRRAGLGSRYGGGATIPVCGDCPAPPKKKRSQHLGYAGCTCKAAGIPDIGAAGGYLGYPG